MTLQERIDKRDHECGRKCTYGSKRAARARAGRAAQRGARLVPYRCRWCGRWHTGHRPPAHVIASIRRLP